MPENKVMPITPRTLLLGLAVLWSLALGGCVTETSGGFSASASQQDALQNYLQLSLRYLEQGDLLNARRHLDNAFAIDRNNSEAYATQALLYTRQGDIQLADDSFRRAIRLNPGNSQARNNYAAFLYARERYREAYEQLEEVVQDTDYRARPRAFENLGLAALRLERVDEAERAFTRALQLNPQQIVSSLELAAISLQKGAVLPARQFYRNYLTLRQFLNVSHSPRSLWIGIKLESALGNEQNVAQYGNILEELYDDSDEYQLYLQSLNDE